ncbi:WxcM-like domain-containing protein [Sphingobacterium bovistauri]|uniref:WxcM-like domain-containing protein n=1 Tax=Sphingobacterium bovistauri TaxID=2781959 RepID=A0ABS7Z1U3_9SPHI|nr:WxcM-like domain-containing protein [Sphingobacterium bovistauri]MCA5004096.1 WxcM-like domain-containing protein [Sphingobacterium bovistauri]
MMNFIEGGIAKDQRGQIRFVNDFDMSLVKRFYIIKNDDLESIRGWRAHRIEQRWFYVLSGAFSIDIVKIDHWEKVSIDLEVRNETLSSLSNNVLHLSPGYATAFRALEPNSELLVFADYGIEHASEDDYTFPLDYFVNRI